MIRCVFDEHFGVGTIRRRPGREGIGVARRTAARLMHALLLQAPTVSGLSIAPPRRTVVRSFEESRRQALDRTQAGLFLQPGKCTTHTHDGERKGTTTLFAALNTLKNTVFGRCAPRHRRRESIAFPDEIEDAAPAGRIIHAITDNFATQERPEVATRPAENRTDGPPPVRAGPP